MYDYFDTRMNYIELLYPLRFLWQNYRNLRLDDFMEVFLFEFFHWLESILSFQKLRPLTSILDLVSNSKKAHNRFEGRFATGWE